MDLAGRNKIMEVLEADLRIPGVSGHEFFNVRPHEYELRGGVEARADAPKDVRFLDIITRADPCLVFETLRNAGMYSGEEHVSEVDDTLPLLKLLGFSHSGNVRIISFEDLNGPSQEVVRL